MLAAATRAKSSTKGTRRWSSRSSPACWRSSGSASMTRRSPTSISTAARATAQARGRAVPERPDCKLFLISLKAGGLGLNLHRRRLCLPARSLVEPRRRGAGHRPRPPHRPDAPGLRLPADRPRHRRGKSPGTTEVQARPGRRHHHRRQQRDPQPDPRRSGIPAIVRRDLTTKSTKVTKCG